VTAVEQRRRDYLTDILKTLEPTEREELVRLFSKVAAAQAEQEIPEQRAQAEGIS
jgi:hypothetical protein